MFGKSKIKNEELTLAVNINSSSEQTDNTSSPMDTKPGNTVIASDVMFSGNISGDKQITVYGSVTGNICVSEGLVTVMRNGHVEGDIQSRKLIIDGNIKGHCRSENIDIGENGRIDGTLTYTFLSIKKGGVFIGKAEELVIPPAVPNIADLNNVNVKQKIDDQDDQTTEYTTLID